MTIDRSASQRGCKRCKPSASFFMAFPIAIFLVLSATTWMELSVPVTAVVQTLVFTLVGLVRKYPVRVHFQGARDEVCEDV